MNETAVQFPLTILCIACPNGCRLTVEKKPDSCAGYTVSGNQCKRGIEFAITEITSPVRTLTTTVRTVFPGVPALPVRSSGEIPKGKLFEVTQFINTVTLDRRLGIGETVIPNVLGMGSDIITTSNILKEPP
jgi:CxxC motif-containing protein